MTHAHGNRSDADWSAIIDLIGHQNTLKLVKQLGGTSFYIPSGVRGKASGLNRLMAIVGLEVTEILREHFGGHNIQIPLLRTSLTSKRLDEFLALYDQEPRPTLQAIARQLGVHVRTVRRYREFLTGKVRTNHATPKKRPARKPRGQCHGCPYAAVGLNEKVVRLVSSRRSARIINTTRLHVNERYPGVFKDFEDGLEVSEIAAKHGVSVATGRRWLSLWRRECPEVAARVLPKNPYEVIREEVVKAFEGGATTALLVEKYGLPGSTIRTWRANWRRKKAEEAAGRINPTAEQLNAKLNRPTGADGHSEG